MRDINSFWNSQPVDVGESNTGIINKPKNVSKIPIELPEGYRWVDMKNPEIITKFLRLHYYKNRGDWYLKYSNESISKIFNSPAFNKSYSIGLVKGNVLYGYIYGHKHKIHCSGVSDTILSVNFLCLIKQARNKKFAPKLIEELTRRAYLNGIYKAIFLRDANTGFRFTEAQYYHLTLNDEKFIIHDIYIPKREKITLKKRPSIKVSEFTNEDFLKMYAIYQKNFFKFDLYDNISFDEFKYMMTPLNNCNYTVFDPNTGHFASFYTIDNYNFTTNVSIKKAYLYYWVGDSDIIRDTIAYAKELGFDMFDVLKIGENESYVIDKFNFTVGSGTLYYHLFNWKQNIKGSCKVNFLLF